MNFTASQFHYTMEDKSYVAEASDLRIGAPGNNITIAGFDFVFTHADKDASDEDTYGWNFKPTMGAINRNPALVGHTVLIIND
jgi:hypothetical protein